MAEYRYTVDYLNEQMCGYLHRTVGELVAHMEQGVAQEPRLAERLAGYQAAIEDVQRLLTPGHRVADTEIKRIMHAARQPRSVSVGEGSGAE